MSSIEINGVKLEADLLDMDAMEKYEKEMNAVSEKVKAARDKGIKGSALMREEMRITDEFFEAFFGVGTAHRLFGDSRNIRPRLEAFNKVAGLADEMRAEVESFRRQAPAGNRAQRRAAAKKK